VKVRYLCPTLASVPVTTLGPGSGSWATVASAPVSHQFHRSSPPMRHDLCSTEPRRTPCQWWIFRWLSSATTCVNGLVHSAQARILTIETLCRLS